jgi:hypothetical protein
LQGEPPKVILILLHGIKPKLDGAILLAMRRKGKIAPFVILEKLLYVAFFHIALEPVPLLVVALPQVYDFLGHPADDNETEVVP